MAISNNITNIDFSVLQKKRYTIDGDENRILELDPSDLGIINRLNETYPKLEALYADMAKITDSTEAKTEEEQFDIASATLAEVDVKMREYIDFIFDTNVCEVCVTHGSMYDPINGVPRFEHIITTLTQLYGDNIAKETKKMKDRIGKHTSKYTGK